MNDEYKGPKQVFDSFVVSTSRRDQAWATQRESLMSMMKDFGAAPLMDFYSTEMERLDEFIPTVNEDCPLQCCIAWTRCAALLKFHEMTCDIIVNEMVWDEGRDAFIFPMPEEDEKDGN